MSCGHFQALEQISDLRSELRVEKHHTTHAEASARAHGRQLQADGGVPRRRGEGWDASGRSSPRPEWLLALQNDQLEQMLDRGPQQHQQQHQERQHQHQHQQQQQQQQQHRQRPIPAGPNLDSYDAELQLARDRAQDFAQKERMGLLRGELQSLQGAKAAARHTAARPPAANQRDVSCCEHKRAT